MADTLYEIPVSSTDLNPTTLLTNTEFSIYATLLNTTASNFTATSSTRIIDMNAVADPSNGVADPNATESMNSSTNYNAMDYNAAAAPNHSIYLNITVLYNTVMSLKTGATLNSVVDPNTNMNSNGVADQNTVTPYNYDTLPINDSYSNGYFYVYTNVAVYLKIFMVSKSYTSF